MMGYYVKRGLFSFCCVTLMNLLGRRPPCPGCGKPMPAYSLPASFRSWLLSRRTCPSCKAEVSWFGTLAGRIRAGR